jgi:hypothetical protein
MALWSNYSSAKDDADNPASGAFAITPHDTNALSEPIRGLYVGVAGDVTVRILPIRVTHIRATGTTATTMLGLT